MINKFIVYSRTAVQVVAMPLVPHVIVSISTPGDMPAEIGTNFWTRRLVQLQFHDLDDYVMQHVEIKDQYEGQCFNKQHAREILEAVADCPDAEVLVVHCDAGLSRSPGVAAALSKILVGDDSGFFYRYHPNMRVYRTLLEEHFAPSD